MGQTGQTERQDWRGEGLLRPTKTDIKMNLFTDNSNRDLYFHINALQHNSDCKNLIE